MSYKSMFTCTNKCMHVCTERGGEEEGKKEGRDRGDADKERTSNGITLAQPTGGPGLGHGFKTKKQNKNKKGS